MEVKRIMNASPYYRQNNQSLFFGRQNIPIRGNTEEKRNFMALLKEDPIQDDDLKNSNVYLYKSLDIQNKLLSLCDKHISSKIVHDCNTAVRFFFYLRNEFMRFVCPAILFIPHEPRKKTLIPYIYKVSNKDLS